jgi:hypothetical protein
VVLRAVRSLSSEVTDEEIKDKRAAGDHEFMKSEIQEFHESRPGKKGYPIRRMAEKRQR